MEYGTIEREIHIDASPEIVFEVISSPEHLQRVVARRGAVRADPRARRGRSSSATPRPAGARSPFTVVDADRRARSPSAGPTRTARSRAEGNSLLVTFELTPRAAARCCG